MEITNLKVEKNNLRNTWQDNEQKSRKISR